LKWTLPFINSSIWSGRKLCHFADTDNELLGVRVLQGAELDALLYEEIERSAEAFGLLGWCDRNEVLDAETRACRALEAGKGLKLDIGGSVRVGGCLERACEVAMELALHRFWRVVA
jgi:hypothetical protein